jgi:hypothetical protein
VFHNHSCCLSYSLSVTRDRSIVDCAFCTWRKQGITASHLRCFARQGMHAKRLGGRLRFLTCLLEDSSSDAIGSFSAVMKDRTSRMTLHCTSTRWVNPRLHVPILIHEAIVDLLQPPWDDCSGGVAMISSLDHQELCRFKPPYFCNSLIKQRCEHIHFDREVYYLEVPVRDSCA